MPRQSDSDEERFAAGRQRAEDRVNEHPHVEIRYEPDTRTLRFTFGAATDEEYDAFRSMRNAADDVCVVKVDENDRVRALLFREERCGLSEQRGAEQASGVDFMYDASVDAWSAVFGRVPNDTMVTTVDALADTPMELIVFVDRCGDAIVGVEVLFVRNTTGAEFAV